jgi:hypothetical protein
MREGAIVLVGAAKLEITPTQLETLELSGYLRQHKKPAAVNDPLYARALLIREHDQALLWITTDLLGLPEDLVARCRMTIAQKLGIPGQSILFASTHTHAAPAVISLLGCGIVDPAYIRVVEARIAAAAELAQSRLKPGTLAFGSGDLHISVNRRKLSVANYPLHDELPGNEVDPLVSVLRAVADNGVTEAVLFHYACHPVCLRSDNDLISADFPGAACSRVEAAYGPQCTALFLNGACGNIVPRRFGGLPEVKLMGDELGRRVLEIADSAALLEAAPIDAELQWIRLPYASVPSPEQLRRKIEQLDAVGDLNLTQHVERMHAAGWLQHAARFRVPDHLTIPCQRLRIGGIQWVGLGGEVMHRLGERIKGWYPDLETKIISYANGNLGYLPSAQDLEAGGYEVGFAATVYNHFPFSSRIDEAVCAGLFGPGRTAGTGSIASL